MNPSCNVRAAFRIVAGCIGLWSVVACSDVREVALDVCGNRVTETGEDCDGQAGCNEDCRYECGGELECPQGWGCDAAAGICNAASGTFTTQELLAASPYRPLVSDMDGDGRDDALLIGSDIPTLVYYFGTDASVERTVQLPAASTAATTDLTGDRLADPLLAGDEFLGYEALRSRSFTALARSSRAVAPTSRLLSADLDCDRRRDLLLLEDKQLYRATTSETLEPIGELDVSAGDIMVEDPNGLMDRTIFATGSLPQPQRAACEIFAVCARDSDVVYVYGAAPPAGTDTLTVKLLSTVSAPGPVDRLLFLDANGDGKSDLLLQGVGTFSQSKYLAYGVGDGTFHSQAAVPAKTGDALAAPALMDVSGTILSVGPEDTVDYVVDESTDTFGSQYLEARALDVTGDNLRDVVAVTFGHLDVLRAHPTGVASKLSLVSNGLGRLRDAGDLDGDGRPDLLVNNGRGLLDPPSVLSVLFTPVEPGSTLLELAELEHTTQAQFGHIESQTGRADPYADVAVIHGQDDALQLTFLQGGADRQLRFPLSTPLAGGQSPTVDFPTFGAFRGFPEIVLFRSSVTGGAASLEVMPVEGGEPGPPERVELPLEGWFNPMLDSVAVWDGSGDGFDDLLVLGQKPGSEVNELFQVSLREGRPPSVSLVAVPEAHWLEGVDVRDVDGDGALDLVAMEVGDELNDGCVHVRLRSEPSEWHRLAWPLEACASTGAYAFLQADLDQPLELALVCAVRLDTFTAAGAEPSGTPTFAGALAIYDIDFSTNTLTLQRPVQPAPLAYQLRAGDFNGDGVQDLMTGGGEVSLLLGEPRQ